MSTPLEQVAEFHRLVHIPVLSRPACPPDDRWSLRMVLLREEFDEVIEAMQERDVAHVAKELADLLYVTYGAALEWGIDLNAVMDAVHASNMSKVGPDGKIVKRSDGKVVKPDGWQEPNIHAVLQLDNSEEICNV
ncbi:MAG: pyrophosphohydrolase domain-containing protein [Acidimicrobiales bacterium]